MQVHEVPHVDECHSIPAGLSMQKFHTRYGTERQCESALFAARWHHGWQCAHCGCKRFFLTPNGHGRQLWECFICGY
ncbi:Transposase zinc-ribbon domain-containing protein [Polaromonas sp. OV174]|nr:Transposase zinc-ribbon domain-containing protein [Polaromonas sp. OV174]